MTGGPEGYGPAMSYPPPGYGPPGYGPQGYGGYQQEHPQGNTVLILGICGLVLCQLCGPFAWSMGNRVLAEIDRNPGAYSNRSAVNTGRILGMVSSILMIVSLALVVLWFVFAIFVIGASSTSGT